MKRILILYATNINVVTLLDIFQIMYRLFGHLHCLCHQVTIQIIAAIQLGAMPVKAQKPVRDQHLERDLPLKMLARHCTVMINTD